MELMLGNLLFSFIVKVGGTALGLGLLMWLGYKFSKSYVKKKHMKIVKRSLVFLWVLVVGVVAMSALMGSGPRVTISDYSKSSPSYEESEVENLNPNQMTRDDRIQENRQAIEENAITD